MAQTRGLQRWVWAACALGLGWPVSGQNIARAQMPQGPGPALLQAMVHAPHFDPRRYLVSEKLDGVRAIWDGQRLRFRSGRPIAAPAWFVAGLPQQALDGELWLGRGRFDELSGLVRSEVPNDAAWRAVRYLVFELPGASGHFAERAATIERLVQQAALPWLQAVQQRRVDGRATLQQWLDDVVRAGGEGLMLHLADAAYTTGRSEVLLKLKPALDAEALVVGHRPGRGRLTGLLGALEMQLPDGRRFLLGTGLSDAQRRDPPPIGSIVSYRYRGLTSTGLPRFASYLRLREQD